MQLSPMQACWYDAHFGFPPTACRWRDSPLAVQSVVEVFRTLPLPGSSRTSHHTPSLHCLFDVIGCLCHQVHHRILRAYHTVPLEPASRIDPNHDGL